MVEIIKREYLKKIKHGPSSVGLHQYNYLYHVEKKAESRTNEEPLDAEAARSLAIIAALDGPKQYVSNAFTCMKRN